MLVTLVTSQRESSSDSKDEQPENISAIFTTEEVLNLEGSRSTKAEHFENIPRIFVTLEVSNSETFKEAKLVHPENMKSISVTADVLKSERSRDVSDEHPENMELMDVTDEVSQPKQLRPVSLEQPLNMLRMLDTAEISSFERSMVLSPVSLEKKPVAESALQTAGALTPWLTRREVALLAALAVSPVHLVVGARVPLSSSVATETTTSPV